MQELAQARPLRDAPRRLRPSRRELRRLRPHVHGARGGRRRRAQRRLRAGLARDVPDLALGLRGAEGALAAADARGRGHRLLRADRAGRRLRSRLDAHARAPRRLGLDPERRQDVDHERHDRRHRDRLGAHGRRRDPRLHRREGHARLLGARDPQEALAARVRHVRARAPGRARARREPASPARRRSAARSRASTRRASGSSSARSAPARACFECALDYAKERIVFGKPIAGVPAHAAEARRDGARDQPRHRSSRSTSAA